MRKYLPKIPTVLIILFSVILVFGYVPNVNAQEDAEESDLGVDVAEFYVIGGEVEGGHIITLKQGKYVKSREIDDPAVIGVVTSNPAVSINPSIDDSSLPVVDSGEANVKVTTMNGDIEIGDVITTSPIAGVGMKQSPDGIFGLGIAKETYANDDKEEIGTIKVDVHLQYAYSEKNNGQETDKQSDESASNEDNQSNDSNKEEDSPRIEKFFKLETISDIFDSFESTSIVRYIIAAIFLIVTFIFGFITLKKIISKGTQALGRNPLASKVIIFDIILNVLITIGIIALGLILAYVALRI